MGTFRFITLSETRQWRSGKFFEIYVAQVYNNNNNNNNLVYHFTLSK